MGPAVNPLSLQEPAACFLRNNLYVKGACFGAKEKCGEENLKVILYQFFSDKEECEHGSGYRGFSEILSSGRSRENWYEIHTYLEIILDDKEDLEFTVIPMEGGTRTRFSMKLPGLPKRPNKTTRLALTIYYESEELCVVRAEDMDSGICIPHREWSGQKRYHGKGGAQWEVTFYVR